MKHLFSCLFIVISISCFGQQSNAPCSSVECNQFNFWVGDWDLTWTDAEGKIIHGSNRVEKTLGNCVVAELKIVILIPFLGMFNPS